jgi:hypothetical protein
MPGGLRRGGNRSRRVPSAERRDALITGATKVAHITTKQDMSRWTRAHADEPGITWSVFPGPGGTMIIVEHAEDRCTLNRASAAARNAATAAGPVGGAGVDRLSA